MAKGVRTKIVYDMFFCKFKFITVGTVENISEMKTYIVIKVIHALQKEISLIFTL